MGHNGINLSGGVSGFTQSMHNLKKNGVENGVKIYAKPLTDKNGNIQTDDQGFVKYNTYSSDNSKGFWFGSTKRQQNKTDNAMKALTDFVNKMATKHNMSKDDRISANALVASVFLDSKNAVSNLNKLANLLEDASGTAQWKTNMRANETAKQTKQEYIDISQGMMTGQKGLLNPKSDFAKAIKTNVMPQDDEPKKKVKHETRVLDLTAELGSM